MSEENNKLVLIIDDDPHICKMLTTFLAKENFTTILAENGRVGLQRFRETNPDLILVDLKMPVLGGLDVLSTVTEESPETPIMVISGNLDIGDAVQAVRRGAWDYILKPIRNYSVFMHSINKALERGRLIRENNAYRDHLEDLVASRTSELEKANRQLRQNEIRYRSVVEDQTETIMRYLPDRKRTFVNDSYCRFFGKSRADLLNKDFLVNVYPEDQKTVLQKIQSLNKNKPAAADERRVRLPNGKIRWQQWTDRAIFDTTGNIKEYQAVGVDITDRKYGEEALKDALKEVERLKERLQDENVYLREEIKLEHNFEEIVGQSNNLKKVLRQVEIVAPNDTTVIIFGESGTGKELIARAIHNLSERRLRPLVKVNCAALPANLIESELFGHEKGAFTGALSRRKGRFELADSGTIFLDEISELPLDLQIKLLRVIQESEFERVGGEETQSVNVRIIAATNRDLLRMVDEGTFREDLYYRLNVIPIQLPPLRDRKEDIELLAIYFARKYGRKMGKNFKQISKKTMQRLKSLNWPGNIRELENVIERAVIFSTEPTLEIDHPVFLPVRQRRSGTEDLKLESIERQHIEKVLESTAWTIEGDTGAALILGLHPNTLRSRMKKLNIVKPAR